MWITSGSFRCLVFVSRFGHLVKAMSGYGFRKNR